MPILVQAYHNIPVFGRNISGLHWTDIGTLAEGAVMKVMLVEEKGSISRLRCSVTDIHNEMVRRDGAEGLPGIIMALDAQSIDKKTLGPSANQHTEPWQASATGTHSGTNSTDDGEDGRGPDHPQHNLPAGHLAARRRGSHSGAKETDPPPLSWTQVLTRCALCFRTSMVHQSVIVLLNDTLLRGANALDDVGRVLFHQGLVDKAISSKMFMLKPGASVSTARDVISSPARRRRLCPRSLGTNRSAGPWLTASWTGSLWASAASAVYDVRYAAAWTADEEEEGPDAPSPGAEGGGGLGPLVLAENRNQTHEVSRENWE